MMSPLADESEKETLVMLESASSFMSDTLDTVLSLQKIEEDKFELELAPFSLNGLLQKIATMYGGVISQKQISLHCEVASDIPGGLVGDQDRLGHVISNLLSNAVKFSPVGKSITLKAVCDEISHSSATSPRSRATGDIANVTISITDEGPGISEANQKLLFNNFIQIRPSELQQGQGSGLGLSFCKELVKLHKGTIGIVSEVSTNLVLT